jgi:hypothetical protein
VCQLFVKEAAMSVSLSLKKKKGKEAAVTERVLSRWHVRKDKAACAPMGIGVQANQGADRKQDFSAPPWLHLP